MSRSHAFSQPPGPINPTFPLLIFPPELVTMVGEACDHPSDHLHLKMGNKNLSGLLDKPLIAAARSYRTRRPLHAHSLLTATPAEAQSALVIKWAQSHSNWSLFFTILDSGFEINSDLESYPGSTLLYFAILEDHVQAAELLLFHGATLAATAWTSPFLAAANWTDTRMMKLMLSRFDADPDASLDDEDNRPLHFVVKHVRNVDLLLEMIAVFAEWDAEFNADNDDGQTPLHVALDEVFERPAAYMQVLRSLLSFGSDPTAVDAQGEDAFDYCHGRRFDPNPAVQERIPLVLRLLNQDEEEDGDEDEENWDEWLDGDAEDAGDFEMEEEDDEEDEEMGEGGVQDGGDGEEGGEIQVGRDGEDVEE